MRPKDLGGFLPSVVPTVTWLDKVRELIGYPHKRGAVPALSEKCGVKRRTLAAWLKGTNVPIDPTIDGTLARIAAALEVTEEWLADGQPGPPPVVRAGIRIPPEALRGVPRKYHRFLYSLADVRRLDAHVAYSAFLDSQTLAQ